MAIKGTTNSATSAMRFTPPKMITPRSTISPAPVMASEMPKVSATAVATVKDCSALKPSPKVSSSRMENSTPIQRRPIPRSM